MLLKRSIFPVDIYSIPLRQCNFFVRKNQRKKKIEMCRRVLLQLIGKCHSRCGGVNAGNLLKQKRFTGGCLQHRLTLSDIVVF